MGIFIATGTFESASEPT